MSNFLRYCGLIALFVITSFFSFSQINLPVPIKFGKIDMADLQMTVYPKDSSADAVVLCDFGDVYYQYSSTRGLQLSFDHICRIKILKKSGYDWATHGATLFKAKNATSREYMEKIKASTYNLENGKMVETKMGKDAIFEDKKTDTQIFKKFTLPNVREGSIIEYSYTITSDFETYIPSWEFQKTIPTAMSEFRVSIPDYFFFRLNVQGYEPYEVSEKTTGGSTTTIPTNSNDYHWILKNAPAIKEEPYMTTINDYVNKVEFDLASITYPNTIPKNYSVTWQDLANDLMQSENFGEQTKHFGFLKDAAADIKKQSKDTLERISLALAFIQKNVKWNENTGLFAENKLKKAFENKIGNDADMNLMLVSLLKELDLKAAPVIISTRTHGRMMENYLLLNKFNYVIAQVEIGGKDMLLDATDPTLKVGMLPMRCLNGIGRLIAKDETAGRWLSLNPAEKDSKTIILNLTLNESGEMAGNWDIYHNGYDGVSHRKAISKDGKAKYIEEFKKKVSNWEFKKLEVEDGADTSPSVTIKADVKTESLAQAAGGRIYFKPLLTESQEKNPFLHNDRKFPVDMGTPIEESLIATYTLPKGYVVEEMPKNIRMNLPEDGGSFRFLLSATADGRIMVSSKLILKKSVFYTEEYSALKQFFDQIIAKHAEQIVLKKI